MLFFFRFRGIEGIAKRGLGFRSSVKKSNHLKLFSSLSHTPKSNICRSSSRAVSLSLGRFRVFKGEFILSIVSHISPLIWNGWIRNPNQIFDLVEVSDLLSYLIDVNGDETLMRKEKGESEFEIHPNRNLSPTPY